MAKIENEPSYAASTLSLKFKDFSRAMHDSSPEADADNASAVFAKARRKVIYW